MLEKLFKLRENNTDVKTEILAGITTFMTMAYIIIVNPAILSAAGLDEGAVLVATVISAGLSSILMGLYANYPFALASGMGLNAFFAYTVAPKVGWQGALAVVMTSGILFLILTLTKVREAIVNGIPYSLKMAVTTGIGLFIAFLGFQNAGIIAYDAGANAFVLGQLSDPNTLLALFGLVLTSVLVVMKVKGALLWGILGTTAVGMGTGLVAMPTGISSFIAAPPSIAPTAFKFIDGYKELFATVGLGFIPLVFSFGFVDLFDSIGTFVGVASKANMLDENGNLPRAEKALMADAIGTMAGAALGTSTVTTYVESASGVAEGGRTGLTAVVTGLLFIASLFLAPLAFMIPGAATAPILIIVGVFMMEPVTKINFGDYLEAIPAFLAIVMMPFAFSIAEGIVWGILAYTGLRLFSGRHKEVSLTMYILSALFIVYLIWG
ncbi:MAG TPA: NCS2 family permease [Firmicutes bacterium]|nr:NCS2 family permease [Bacillota bacterium]